jgi:hypothetical protein
MRKKATLAASSACINFLQTPRVVAPRQNSIANAVWLSSTRRSNAGSLGCALFSQASFPLAFHSARWCSTRASAKHR